MTFFNNTIFIAALSAQPSFLEALRFQAVGFLVVMVSLGLIALMLGLMGYCFKKSGNRKRQATVAATLPEKPLPDVREDDPELVAVIAAAVGSVIKGSHRVVSIRPVDTGGVSGELYLQAWSMEGRRQHFASHKIR